jgi:hypothetical protein
MIEEYSRHDRGHRRRLVQSNFLLITFRPGRYLLANLWIYARKAGWREFSACFSFPILPSDSLDLNSADPC